MKRVSFAILLGVGASSVGELEARSTTVAGWVSDESCGAAHIKPGNESCVRKCLRGGASVGHPEWKPQRMILITDDGKRFWFVENPDSLIDQTGRHVTVVVSFGEATETIRILRRRSK